MAVKEPEFAHVLAEVAEHVLSSFGRLMASPDAARHVYDALFYYFEGVRDEGWGVAVCAYRAHCQRSC